ncbi:small multidrug resistance protein [Paenibacillus curdlanolyticus YK9]|uniref:Small multidrug resistance protein n=1 Tax=Paenibacillus curdlanolyticus YK9 TaxID=717606 RepID=E0IEN4_9BACL|nr:multidrug efflux SMR transporter [Paenibacillus curdlanolyticus]EFM09122.1 small multidrug resistance protein [Paenibacillus curdlanolyticus YK9]
MSWMYLIIAGFLEVGWAFGLQESHGFTRLVPSIVTIVTLAASFMLFAKAMKTIEIGTAYAIFTGLGTAGTVLVGMLFLDEPVQIGKLFFVTLLLCGIVGLKVVAKEKQPQEQSVQQRSEVERQQEHEHEHEHEQVKEVQ